MIFKTHETHPLRNRFSATMKSFAKTAHQCNTSPPHPADAPLLHPNDHVCMRCPFPQHTRLPAEPGGKRRKKGTRNHFSISPSVSLPPSRVQSQQGRLRRLAFGKRPTISATAKCPKRQDDHGVLQIDYARDLYNKMSPTFASPHPALRSFPDPLSLSKRDCSVFGCGPTFCSRMLGASFINYLQPDDDFCPDRPIDNMRTCSWVEWVGDLIFLITPKNDRLGGHCADCWGAGM